METLINRGLIHAVRTEGVLEIAGAKTVVLSSSVLLVGVLMAALTLCAVEVPDVVLVVAGIALGMGGLFAAPSLVFGLSCLLDVDTRMKIDAPEAYIRLRVARGARFRTHNVEFEE